MTKEVIRYALWFAVLVVLQVVVFNRVCLWGVAVPLVFIYFILKLPVTLGANWRLTLGFVLGLCVDIFSDTPGLNALCCTILAALRPLLLHLYYPREEDLSNPEPSTRTLGPGVFLKYALTATALYCLLFFMVEDAAFFAPWLVAARIGASTLLTTACIAAADMMRA